MPTLPPTLPPESPSDNALDDLIQAHLASVTGIDPTLVRPRWQRTPPVQPDFDTNWLAFGLNSGSPDGNAYTKHNGATGGTDLGSTDVERGETMLYLLSFYGPQASLYAGRYRDGIQVDFNRFDLQRAGIKVVEVGDSLKVPALVKETWVNRVDVRATYRRRTRHRYAIHSIGSAHLELDNEQYTTPINVTP